MKLFWLNISGEGLCIRCNEEYVLNEEYVEEEELSSDEISEDELDSLYDSDDRDYQYEDVQQVKQQCHVSHCSTHVSGHFAHWCAVLKV